MAYKRNQPQAPQLIVLDEQTASIVRQMAQMQHESDPTLTPEQILSSIAKLLQAPEYAVAQALVDTSEDTKNALPKAQIYPEGDPNFGKDHPQKLFLDSQADIVIYGGAAGGGKTFGLFLEAVRDRDIAGARFVYFRRQQADINKAGGPWDKSMQFFPLFGAQPNKTNYKWKFPSGAEGQFASLQYDQDVLNWHTAEIDLFLFDELTTFTEDQFWYMLSRNRSTSKARKRIRAGTNPDASSWVKKLIAPWVDSRWEGVKAATGELRYIARDPEGQLMWVEKDWRYPPNLAGYEAKPKSITFIPSKLGDNLALTAADPGYESNLLMQDAVNAARLLNGDWDILESNYFDQFGAEHVREAMYRPEPGYRPPTWYTFFGGLDWGYSDPYAFVLGALDENGRTHILESEEEAKLTDPQQAMHVTSMLTRWGIPLSKCLIVADGSMWTDQKDGIYTEPHISAFHKAGLKCAAAGNSHDECVSRMSLIRNQLEVPGEFRIYGGFNRDLVQSLTMAKEGKGSRKEYIEHNAASHLVYALGCALASWPQMAKLPDAEKPPELVYAETNQSAVDTALDERNARMGLKRDGFHEDGSVRWVQSKKAKARRRPVGV